MVVMAAAGFSAAVTWAAVGWTTPAKGLENTTASVPARSVHVTVMWSPTEALSTGLAPCGALTVWLVFVFVQSQLGAAACAGGATKTASPNVAVSAASAAIPV